MTLRFFILSQADSSLPQLRGTRSLRSFLVSNTLHKNTQKLRVFSMRFTQYLHHMLYIVQRKAFSKNFTFGNVKTLTP